MCYRNTLYNIFQISIGDDGKFSMSDINNISRILSNKRTTRFAKLRDLKDLRLLEDNKYCNYTQLRAYRTLLDILKKESEIEDRIENETYYSEIFIPVENPDQLFGEEFEKLLQKHLRK